MDNLIFLMEEVKNFKSFHHIFPMDSHLCSTYISKPQTPINRELERVFLFSTVPNKKETEIISYID